MSELAQTVASQQAGRLTKIPGIGKKTAERLLLELKGKLAPDLGLPGAAAASDAQADIQQALLALGYSEKEAAAALKDLPADAGVSEGIKLALKKLAIPIFNRVRLLRAERDMTRAQLAARVDVNPQTIGALERGDHSPSLDLAMRICEVFELPVEAVFSRKQFEPMSTHIYNRG